MIAVQADTRSPAPLVSAPAGPIRGRRLHLADGRVVRRYAGIPYAAPPLGELRWRPPQAVQPWTEPLEAAEFGPDLLQPPVTRLRGPRQAEDCLYLNIWTPDESASAAWPVIVWIHGGSYLGGSGSEPEHDAAMLAAEGAVVVTFNYRAGLFGFLAHPALSAESPHGVSGNYGLLDQIAALRWVRENAGAFGGDARAITASGVSAGAASVALLLTSPHAHGLFERAILHSPGAARPLMGLLQAEQAGCVLGEDVGALRMLPATDLLKKTGLLTPAVRGLTTPRVLRPVRDGWLIPTDEAEALHAGRFQRMPLMLGTNTDEGTSLTRSWPIEDVAAWRELMEANFGERVDQAMALYPVARNEDVRPQLSAVFGDTQFNWGTRLYARCMGGSGQPTYRYVFTRRQPGQTEGPLHGQETAYAFGNLGTIYPDSAEWDHQLSAAMRRYWLDFARTADPNGAGLPRWQRFDPQADNHLTFGDAIEPGTGWRRETLDFLDGYFGWTSPPSTGRNKA